MTIKNEWLSHPITKEQINTLNEWRQKHLNGLIAVAATSSDVKVQHHAVSIKTIELILNEISKTDRNNDEKNI